MIRFFSIFFVLLFATSSHAQSLKMAVTTSFNNSGLSDVLLPEIKKDLGIDVQLLVVGTGQALKLGRSGDVDAILVHSKTAEHEFVQDGFGLHRREIMYNDFVIIGPAEDPAQIAKLDQAGAALKHIAQTKATFVSRGDDSGTHKKELSLWQSAVQNPETFANWYREVGAGMGAALNTAAGINAYVLADRASWLNFKNKAGLKLLFSGDPVLFNQYTFLPVHPERHPHVKSKLVSELETWLTSPRAQTLINGYKIEGETLFTFNAK